MATLRAEIDAARSAGVDRQWLTTSLRWAYENLHFPPKPIYLTRAKGSAPSPNWISGPAIASA